MMRTRRRVALAAVLATSTAACDVDRTPGADDVGERLGEVPEVVDTTTPSALSAAFRAAAGRALEAVVYVTVQQVVAPNQGAQVPDPFRRFFGLPEGDLPPQVQEGSGSGFIVDSSGYILTNNHVVAEATTILVRLMDGREYYAELVGTDPYTDVAVLRVLDVDRPLPSVELGNSDQVRVGDWVLALGNPLGLDFSVTAGIVSAKGRSLPLPATSLQAFIQTDAAINPGNSGGPLIDLTGQVVGINTAIFGGRTFVGYGFAIPINLVRRVVSDILDVGYVRRPRLGVFVKDVTAIDAQVAGLPRVRGAYVTAVEPGSPAAQAGIRPGDVVLALGQDSVAGSTELTTRLAQLQPGQEVSLAVFRDGEVSDVRVELGSFPQPERRARAQRGRTPEVRLGVSVVPLTADVARQLGIQTNGAGVVIADVSPSSPAGRAGVRPGQVLLTLNGQPIRTPAELRTAVERLEPRRPVSLRLRDPEMGEMILNFRVQ